MEIEIRHQSVVESGADVIVNAANSDLASGGGVCGAIFNACGHKELTRECKAIGPIKTGHAVMTNAYNLTTSKKIIHAVGPIYRGLEEDEIDLKHAYYNSLVLADSNAYSSLAFCSISTGIYGYPLSEGAKVALKVISSFKANYLKKVIICCFTEKEYQVFKDEYQKLLSNN